MTQSAVARFEAGGTVPSLPVLDRLARALDADLVVHLTPRGQPDQPLNTGAWAQIRQCSSYACDALYGPYYVMDG